MVEKKALLLVLPLLLTPLRAQDFSSWLNREKEAFQDYREKEDRAFREYLREEWEEFNSFKGLRLYEEPKNPRQPVLNSSGSTSTAHSAQRTWNTVNSPHGQANRFFDYSLRGLPSIMVEIYGVSIRLPRPEVDLPLLRGGSPRDVSDYFSALSGLDLTLTEHALNRAAEDLNIGDWGYAELAYNFACGAAGADADAAYPLTWYLLLKTGYDVRLASDGSSGGIYLLLPVTQQLYNMPYAAINGKVFYFIDFSLQDRQPVRFFTYPNGHPGATRSVQIDFSSQPELPETILTRTLSFNFREKQYNLDINYDNSLIEYYAHFPQTDFSTYLSGETSRSFLASVKTTIKPLLRGMSGQETVNLLLRLVQTSFAYRTDQDQFSREKWMLPEETVYYPYSDCDDRALLFAWLVRELTGFEVVGIRWPGHMAAAVAIPGGSGGAAFTYKGGLWTLCDPTYMGADAGMVMPDYSGRSFQIIERK